MEEKVYTPKEEGMLRESDVKDIIIKMAKEKEKVLQEVVEQVESEKSKYSSFGGDCSTCSIEIPDYLKNNKI